MCLACVRSHVPYQRILQTNIRHRTIFDTCNLLFFISTANEFPCSNTDRCAVHQAAAHIIHDFDQTISTTYIHSFHLHFVHAHKCRLPCSMLRQQISIAQYISSPMLIFIYYENERTNCTINATQKPMDPWLCVAPAPRSKADTIFAIIVHNLSMNSIFFSV